MVAFNGYPDNCPNERYPEKPIPKGIQSRIETIPNEHLHSCLSVAYVCLVRTLYKDAFNEKLFFLRNVSNL